MTDFVKQILTGQFEAALCMLNDCIRRCPAEHWESKIGNDTFRQVSYHTLFYVDVYCSTSEAAFQMRELHARGGDEFTNTGPSVGLSQDETLAYVTTCREKALAALAAETTESLHGPSGFSWLAFSRAESHLYNLRHIQHHTGQLSAFLRRVVKPEEGWWVRTGWR